MIIQQIKTYKKAVPLNKPFKTALRTVTVAEAIYVEVTLDNGMKGYGEAPPTHVVTGDSMASIQFAIEEVFAPQLIGQDLRYHDHVFKLLHKAMVRNTSAKAAVDMALYDLLGKAANMPLYQFLGGARSELKTDFTVSVNEPAEMADDAQRYVENGFDVLKIKVGIGSPEDDIRRIQAIRKVVSDDVVLRLDANQGWSAKDAVRIIGRMEDLDLGIELIEQPVPAHDIDGLAYVTNHTLTPIMADESIFSLYDARRIIEERAADMFNIKLMKAGGIYEALKINALAQSYDMTCMVGSMIETKLGVTAAAHFAASQSNILYYDFDAPLMLKEETVDGGIVYDGSRVTFTDAPGLGIGGIKSCQH